MIVYNSIAYKYREGYTGEIDFSLASISKTKTKIQ